MTSPLDSYTRSLDDLRFSNEAKARMSDSLRGAAAQEADKGDTGKSAPHLSVLDGTAQHPARRAARRRARRGRHWARIAAALALATVLSGGGTVAVATGILPNPANVLSDIFGGSPAQTELLNDIGHPVGASATSNGVTVTADAVVGDRSNYTVVYSIAFDDPAALEGITANSNGILPLIADATSYVDGTTSGGGGAWFFDADPGDNTIQYAESMSFTTWNGEGIIGHTMRFSLKGIRTLEGEDSQTIASGTWDLKYEMNYVDTTRNLTCGQKTSWQGSEVTVDAIAVSSVGITVDYTIDRQMGNLGSSGKMSDEARAEQDAVIGLPISVQFADGTTFDATNANSTATKQADGTSAVTKSVTYDRIVSAADIVSVTVGDVEVPVAGA